MRILSIITIIMFSYLINFDEASAQTRVLITYYSQTGNTKIMAEAVASGASEVENIEVILKAIEHTTREDLLSASAIIVGSPVHNAHMAPAVSQFIAGWPFEDAPLRGKLGAAFVTAGGISAGEEVATLGILKSMLIFGMIVMGGADWKSPFGASAIVNEQPFDTNNAIDEMFLKKARELGKRVAQTAKKLNP